MKIIKQRVSFSSCDGLEIEFAECSIATESDKHYTVEGHNFSEVIDKKGVSTCHIQLDEIYAGQCEWGENGCLVNVFRFKEDLPESDINYEHDFDFYEIASHEFARFDLTKDLWINRNGEIEPRRSEVTA